ncbi:hypothetical protein G6F47_013562 [Rhizopus delemar]|nr:hypothetical protein G6F49_013095 [Rhizopus delemar]KAG1573163.1 hypothetical protein G6F47_013562 [Rhizopus delemar]
MLWSAITYAGVGWMCKVNGNMDKELYREILEDELERTTEFNIDKLELEPPKGMNELYERVTKVWYDLMKPEECQKVIESMPKRIKQCIKNKGRWTDY